MIHGSPPQAAELAQLHHRRKQIVSLEGQGGNQRHVWDDEKHGKVTRGRLCLSSSLGGGGQSAKRQRLTADAKALVGYTRRAKASRHLC